MPDPGGPDPASPRLRLELSGRGKLTKAGKVLTKREYDAIHRRSVRFSTEILTVLCASSPEGRGPRFGCAVSRKVGNAVVRNRLKRLMREVFRQSREGLPHVDLVVILRPPAAALAEQDLVTMSNVLFPAWSAAVERWRVGLSSPRRRRAKKAPPDGHRPRRDTRDGRRRR